MALFYLIQFESKLLRTWMASLHFEPMLEAGLLVKDLATLSAVACSALFEQGC